MQVVKRNGRTEEVRFDKIIQRIKSLSENLALDPAFLAQRAITGLHDNIATKAIDQFLAETAAVLSSEHPDYGALAARLAVSSLHKDTSASFYQTSKRLYKAGILSERYIHKLRQMTPAPDEMIDYRRDFDFAYFGFKTLERSYLLRIDDVIVERPQHLFMRVALDLCDTIDEVKKLYDNLSLGHYTHATPTLFNAGTIRPQLSSCFLQEIPDSVDGIFQSLSDCAQISKYAGGIGLHLHSVRAKGTPIKSTNGKSNGIIPMLKVFNETARYIDQGGGKRKGSFAVYLEPWHADVEEFLELKKPTGKEELRARDLFLALWVPDLFMKRVEQDLHWTLMCPSAQPGLSDVYGAEFDALYERYEKEYPKLKRIKARDLMSKIIESQLESGVPYILFKDACNAKSNQKNIGVIKSSNLCVEILEVSNAEETAVCNLASIALPKCLTDGAFDFAKLSALTHGAIRTLNYVIDKNYYPTPKTERSNMRHRPVGLGVQGLCDVFAALKMPFSSAEAKALDEKIFATMYYAALEESCKIAQGKGAYETFQGSPASQGQLQFDLWNQEPCDIGRDWNALKRRIQEHGLRNSLLLALMPTASTSQILNNTECFEVPTSNMYKRQTLAGEFVVINKYLVRDLEALDMWNADMRQAIVKANGSVQGILSIPEPLRELYKTTWETSQRDVIDHAAARAPYVCQSQSMNLFFGREKASVGNINKALFYAWKKGLKTGSYYIRTQSAMDATKVTTKIDAIACSIDNKDECLACQ